MKIQATTLLTMLIAIAALAGCSSDTADDLCDGPLAISNSPDITGGPTLSASSVAGGTTVTVTVPVDAETVSVMVGFAETGTTSMVGTAMGADVGGAVSVSIDVPAPTVVTPKTYYPVILLCSADLVSVIADSTTCSPGTGYVEDTTDIISLSNYVRANYNGTSVDLSNLANSCVSMPILSVN
ncbi:MAG: hypothetical protein OEZ10_13630 [Gammaproteobacteria bacterium]|nr:hypothetical protein [Gammaproteobacteria bacterium]